MIPRDDIQELAAGHALGVLDPADRRRAEALIAAGDLEFEAALRDFGDAAALLAHAAPPVTAATGLRMRVLEAVRTEGESAAPARVLRLPGRRSTWTRGWTVGWVAAAAAFAIATFITAREARVAREQLAETRERVAELQRSLGEERQWAELLTSTRTRQVRLAATPDGDAQLAAVALYDPLSQRALVTFEHFAAPTGHDYELWAIRDGKPASLGLIRADGSGRAVMRLQEVGSAAALGAFAVSLEATGGSPRDDAPGGPVVMVGALAGP